MSAATQETCKFDDAGNLKPAKDNSTERIDGILATIVAIGRALLAQEEPSPSIRCILSEGY
jgi:hypothetical protein